MTTDHRLTTRQMAEFVANGFIRFDAVVPLEVNEQGIEEMRRLERERFTPEGLEPPHTGTPLDECYPAPSAIGDDLRLPRIHGIIESFVGANPTFDHDFTHHIRPGSTYTQPLHVDAITDSPIPSSTSSCSGTRTTSRPARVAPVSCPAATSVGCAHPGSTATSTSQVNSSSPVRRAPWPQVRLWNTGDDTYGVDHYLTRLEGRAALAGSG